jgi:hypothetical protein
MEAALLSIADRLYMRRDHFLLQWIPFDGTGSRQDNLGSQRLVLRVTGVGHSMQLRR